MQASMAARTSHEARWTALILPSRLAHSRRLLAFSFFARSFSVFLFLFSFLWTSRFFFTSATVGSSSASSSSSGNTNKM